MRARWLIFLTLTTILAGCVDGGPTGTGLSTSISGNLIEVEFPAGTSPATVAAVQVTIDEVPEVEGATDDAGDFEIVGTFSGLLNVRFTTGDVSVAQLLDVPAGSSIVLQDVAIGPHTIRMRAARQLGFFGTIALADCVAGDLLVDDRAARSNQFLVRLDAQTLLVDGDGKPVSCSGLEIGKPVAIEGVIRLADRTIEALTVTVDPPAPGDPSAIVETDFAGTVTLINCQSAMAQIEARTGPIRLRFSDESELLDQSEQPIDCNAITAGDSVAGTGLIRVRRPERIDVLEMRVTPQRGE